MQHLHNYCGEALQVQRGTGTPTACVIGIDGGTESLRAHVSDLAGRSRGVGKGACISSFPKPGWAGQTPGHWWHAAGVAVRDALAPPRAMQR